MAVAVKISGLVLGALVAFSVIAPASDASAGHRHNRHHNGDAALIAGVAGVLLGAAIASPPAYAVPQGQVIYVEPQPVYSQPVYSQPVYSQPVYGEPVYAQPVYDEPQYSGTDPYRVEPQERQIRRPLNHYQQPQPYSQPRHKNHGPKVVTYDETIGGGGYGGSYEPWSESWMNYCSSKFRSFDPRTGTYKGYDGLRHFCVVR